MYEDDDLYEILQVHTSARPEVITAAYRRLLRIYHPDVNSSPDATRNTARLNYAYEILGDQQRRASYDRERAQYASSPRPSGANRTSAPRENDADPYRSSQDSPRPDRPIKFRFPRFTWPVSVVLLVVALVALRTVLADVDPLIERESPNSVPPRLASISTVIPTSTVVPLFGLRTTVPQAQPAPPAATSKTTADEYLVNASENWQNGRLNAALTIIETAKLIDPMNAEAYNLAALIRASLVDFDRALVEANAAIEIEPESPYIIDTLAYVYLKRHEYKSALAKYESIRYQSSNDENANLPYKHLGLGLSLFGLGRVSEGTAAVEKGLIEAKQDRNPDPQLTDLIAMGGKALDFHIEISPTPTATKTPRPTFTPIATSTMEPPSLASLEEGFDFLDEGEPYKAIDSFTLAIQLEPDLAEAYAGRAYAFEDLYLYDVAIDAITKAVELEPDNPVYRYRRAGMYWIQEQFDESIDDLRRIVGPGYEYPEAHNLAALVYVSAGDLDQALLEVESALLEASDPIDVDYYRDTKAYVYLRRHEFQKALTVYSSIESRDNFTEGFMNLGIGLAYFNLDNTSQAAPFLTSGLEQAEDLEYRDPQLDYLVLKGNEALKGISRISATPTKTRTPIPTSTRIPIPTSTPIIRAFSTPAFTYGPKSGSLEHVVGKMKMSTAYVNVSDMILQAQFVNPYSTDDGAWDYGFMFRSDGSGSFDIVRISSDGSWSHWRRKNGEVDEDRTLRTGMLPINILEDETNKMIIVAIGDKGWFMLNGIFVNTLNLSDSEVSGSISVVTGAQQGHTIRGSSTDFREFSIQELSLTYGPADGSLLSEEGLISTSSPDLDMYNAVVEAEFQIPYASYIGTWSYGFLIRYQGKNSFDAVFVSNNKRWHHYARTGTIDSTDLIDTGAIHDRADFDSSFPGGNKLTLITVGRDGWLLVNDEHVAGLRFLTNAGGGDYQAMSGFFKSDEMSGAVTEFEDFTVWSP